MNINEVLNNAPQRNKQLRSAFIGCNIETVIKGQ